MEIIPLTGGDRAPLDVLAERLRAGAVVPLLADRDLSAARRRGDVLRRPHPDAGRPGDAGAAHRRAALRRDVWYEPDRPVGSLSHRIALPTGRVARRPGPPR